MLCVNFAMISKDTYLRSISIALFVLSMTWSFTDSLPEKAEHLSPWDDNWFRWTTWNPYDRYKITLRPPVTYDKPTSPISSTPIVFFVIGGVLILSLFALFIKYLCTNSNDGDDNYDTGRVLHPPPAVIIPPPARAYQDTVLQPPPQHTRNATPVFLGGGLHRAPAAHPTDGPGDKPPGYSEVVMADFVEQMKYPGVVERLPDTPPPKYEDGNLPKY